MFLNEDQVDALTSVRLFVLLNIDTAECVDALYRKAAETYLGKFRGTKGGTILMSILRHANPSGLMEDLSTIHDQHIMKPT